MITPEQVNNAPFNLMINKLNEIEIIVKKIDEKIEKDLDSLKYRTENKNGQNIKNNKD